MTDRLLLVGETLVLFLTITMVTDDPFRAVSKSHRHGTCNKNTSVQHISGSLGVSALLEQPCLQHSLHALPNKVLGKSTRCILSMKEYFSIVCSINRTSCRAVVCD